MVRKKTLSELDQAEIKLQSLLEKRDALNREAQLLRQERDLVHETKRQIGATLRALKDSMKRLKQLEILKADHDKIAKEIRDIDSGITDFFQAAEKEHEAAIALSEKARSVHEETVGIVHQISALIHDGNEKHEAFLAARDKADEVHAKVVEMREKVLSIRGAKRSEA